MPARKHGAKPRVTSEKLAISFSRGTVGKVRKAAKRRSAGNVSAWLEEAALDRLRHEALGDAIAYYESKNGKITDDDLVAVKAKWPKKG